jgi:hypothetical protein
MEPMNGISSLKHRAFRMIAPVLLTAIGLVQWGQPVSAREPFWAEHGIDLTNLSEGQVLFLESTLNQLRGLRPGELRINPGVYRRLSRFRDLFGFPFNGNDLFNWLLGRIDSISYQNTWTTAVNQNRGGFLVGTAFFSQLDPVERMYLLVHEARHSDGKGYKHVKCPEGFPFLSATQPDIDLEKEPSCDAVKDGAYSFQAAFLFELYAYGLFDQRETGLLYNSSVSRVVPH